MTEDARRDNDVPPTPQQLRQEARDAKRAAKDLAYEARQSRRHADDVQVLHGRAVIDVDGLVEAFPEPESPEYDPGTVRRRIVHGAILVLLLALVAAAVVLVGMVQRGELDLKAVFSRATPAAASCPAGVLNYPPNGTMNVHVYNGGGAEGLAGVVGAELGSRGYHVLSISNGATELSAPAVIVAGPAGHAEAFNLQRNILGADFVEDDRADASIDVILTAAFTGLVDAAAVDQTPGPLTCPHLLPPTASAAPTP